MKKIIYALILSLVVVSGLVFANRENKSETSKELTQKPISIAERQIALEKWKTTPDGIVFKKWEESPAGKKVYASEAKIRKSINDYTKMDGIITSLSLPPDSKLGFGIMVRIKGDDYILSFGPENFNDDGFWQLHGLKVNDRIIIKSHSVSHAPKYSYPILSGDYVERDGKVIYKRVISKDGC
ncbi:hypothetical protein [Flavobacterium sp. N502540]|uniref:hypothetical protein n=1 Tax=Flavobacterium sp. N502540 TaxID=2986838 RepID=UPI0022246DEC|nr:hypothetical protein [Flavobacterium sp. N502540]